MYDQPEVGEVTGSDLDDMGEVLLDIEEAEDAVLKACRFAQQLGIRARPRRGAELECIYQALGDEVEATHVTDRGVTELLPGIDAGEMQVYSLGPAPQLISLKDAELKLGRNATRGAARDEDTVTVGNLRFAAVQVAQVCTLTITYTDAENAQSVLTLTFTGTAQPALGNTFNLKGKINSASSLVKVE
jgi:hypothetical protein